MLRLHVAEKEEVPVMSVTVFDALGREVADLTSALNLSSNNGDSFVQFNASHLPAGVYYAVLRTPHSEVRSNGIVIL